MAQPTPTIEPPSLAPALARLPEAEEHEANLDGIQMRYWQAGSGPALVLIHGFMGYSFSWRFNVQELAQRFTVYAVDLPGCGFSRRDRELPGSLAGDAHAVQRLMDHLGVQHYDVLGTSRGGGVAIVLAAIATEGGQSRVRRLILNAPINPWSSNGKLLTKLLATAVGGFCVLHVLPKVPFILQRYFNGLYADPARIAPGTLEGYEAGFKPQGTFDHLLAIVRHWHKDLKQIEDSLPAIGNIPTLLLWGDRDTAVFPSSIPELHSRLPKSEILLMKNVGHMPYEEVPRDFDRIVCDFLLPNPAELANQTASAQRLS